MSELLYGIQPVLSALKQERRKFDKLYIKNNANSSLRLMEIYEIARKSKIPVEEVSKSLLSEMCPGSVHQGIVLRCSALAFSKFEEHPQIFRKQFPIIIVLDQIEDPHNFGAIIRTCGFFDVEAAVVARHHSSQLNAVVSKASAGVSEWFPVFKVPNLTRFINKYKLKGFWVIGLDENAIQSVSSIKKDRPLIVVLGNEGRGIRKLLKNNCDILCRIPGNKKISSLNVSNAAAVVLSKLSKFSKIPE